MERREALEAAFEELETTTPEEEVKSHASEQEAVEGEQGGGEPLAPEPKAEALAETKGGKEGEKVPTRTVGDKAPKIGETPKEKDEALGRAAAAAAGAEVGKAPVSWKPAAKAAWDKLPVDVRQDVVRREKEMQQYISQNDHHRRFSEGFAQVTKPFEHLIRSQNSTPLQAVRNLMTTAAGLSTGNHEQKAMIVAEIIGNYGVDIETLDKVLSNGAAKTADRGQGQIHPAMLQALQPVYGFMNEVQEARAQRQQRQYQEAENQIEKNANKPYFDDLSDDMADLMEIAAKRGVELSLEEAYEKAVALNPEISKIITQQKAAEEARRNGGTRIARARRAASTITGAPAGGGNKNAPESRREQLEAAWEDATSH